LSSQQILPRQELPRVFEKEKYFRETGYFPFAAQQEVHWDTHRHRALSNGRRWGKSLVGGKEAEATAWVKNRLGEAQRGWIVGPEYGDAEKEFRILYDSLKKLGVDQVSSKFLNNTENGNMRIHTRWGWDLQCRSAKHPETLVGEGLDFVLLVEAGRLRRSMFAQYIRPSLSDKRGWSLSSGVPEMATGTSLLYWAWKRGQDKSRLPWKSWRKPSWTNTIIFPGGRQDPEILEAEEDLTKDEFRRQYGGEFVDRVGRVMQEWDDEIHLKNIGFNPNWPVYAAVDYGYTNPFVWLWIQVDEFNNIYVLEEHYILRQDVAEIARGTLMNHPLLEHLVAFYPDPHDPDDTKVLMRELKKSARTNTNGPLNTRNRMVRERLKPMPEHAEPKDQQAGLVIDINKCPKLAWEMREGYRWPEHKDEMRNESEVPMDKDNHGPEALSRFIYGYFSIVGGGERSSRRSKVRINH